MKRLAAVTAVLLSLGAGAWSQTDGNADGFAERFDVAEALRRGTDGPADPDRAFELFSGLADEGMARAKDRVAYALWRGVGTDKDVVRAEVVYREAIIGGHLKSMINLGRLLSEEGRGADARAILNEAVAAEISGAEFWLARGDAMESFGDASDPDSGVVALLAFAEAGDANATLIVADLLLDGRTALGYDAERAFEMYSGLAETGNATALYRVGIAQWRGLGTEIDLDKATESIKASYEAGRTSALINLGRVAGEAGRTDDAYDALATARDQGLSNADYWFARGHFEDWYGERTDDASGLPVLRALAAGGSVTPALYLTGQADDRRVTSEVLRGLIPALETASDSLDGDASAALMRLFRERPRLISNPIDVRQEIMADHGGQIRPDLRLEEQVALVADTTRGGDRYRGILDLLSEAEGNVHERGLLQAYREDRRTYTYILQTELAERGFFNGAPNGLMTRATVIAFREFCQEENLDHICTHGPLRIDAVRAMSSVFGAPPG